MLQLRRKIYRKILIVAEKNRVEDPVRVRVSRKAWRMISTKTRYEPCTKTRLLKNPRVSYLLGERFKPKFFLTYMWGGWGVTTPFTGENKPN